MRGLRTIALGIALAGSGRFVPSSFAQAHDVDYCVTKLSTFVGEIDDLLARRPSDLLNVLAVLYGYFPAGAAFHGTALSKCPPEGARPTGCPGAGTAT